MSEFTHPSGDSTHVIRPDLLEAYERAWAHIAAPGTWLTGAERVAVSSATRRARQCDFCRERLAALSPHAVDGIHDDQGLLSPVLVDLLHRVTTDAQRLSESELRQILENELSPEVYVEALGVAVITISVDRFHHAMGLALTPLPSPIPGEPARDPVQDPDTDAAWVPMMKSRALGPLIGLPPGPVPNVVRALSLVPAEVIAWQDLSSAQYLPISSIMRLGPLDRALDRSQIELVAGRVSALNECFY